MLQPLHGIRVLDWGAYHAGPGAAAVLADLGAEVIKIEQLGKGDPSRGQFLINRSSFRMANGESLWNECANRGKKSVALDIDQEEGREAAYRLAARSDVFISNFRRSRVKAAKMDYAALEPMNRRLIYVWISAYGPKGPDAERGGFDYQGQGRSGLMWAVGEEGMPPLVSQFGIMDQATAIMASHEVLAALFMRERTGMGQEIHVSMLGTGIYWHYINVFTALVGDMEIPRHVRTKEHATRNYYRCADDRWLIITIPAQKRQSQWKKFCTLLGRPELAADPRFATDDKRLAHSEVLIPILDEIFATRPRDEWLRILKTADIVCSEVNRPSELADDPQVLANGYIVEFDHPERGKTRIPGYPAHFGRAWAGTRRAAPRLGEHTEEVLREVAGYTVEEIARFREKGVI